MQSVIDLVSAAQGFAEFDRHETILPLNEPKVGLNGFIAIHRTRNSHPSLGATRLWYYANKDEALRDVLRLSRLMSYKSALAGLPYGGAKAVLIAPPGGLPGRTVLFKAYSRVVESLRGKFVTGTDVGLSNDDLKVMQTETSYVIGEGVNAGYFTALGVFYGLELLLNKIFGSMDLRGRRFAIQGLGKTGFELLSLMAKAGAEKIYVSDLDLQKIAIARKQFPNVVVVDATEIHEQPVDIYCPCALGGVLNQNTVNEIKAKGIVGSANNQLADVGVGKKLHEKNIVYAPDYLVNAGGLISVVDQYEHKVHDENRIVERIKKIPETLKLILTRSEAQNRATNEIADEIARALVDNESFSLT